MDIFFKKGLKMLQNHNKSALQSARRRPGDLVRPPGDTEHKSSFQGRRTVGTLVPGALRLQPSRARYVCPLGAGGGAGAAECSGAAKHNVNVGARGTSDPGARVGQGSALRTDHMFRAFCLPDTRLRNAPAVTCQVAASQRSGA
ncbi:unnamed protein product [Boreogadus saida]